MPCLFGVKSGMTKFYDEEGRSIPITVISLQEDTVITQVKSKEKEGYSSVQLGFRKKKAQRVNKAEKGHFKKANAPGFYHVEEFRLQKEDPSFVPGAVVSADFLSPGTAIDIQGTTKGKGFQGSVKVWNFRGQPASHGHSVSHRSPGSIGNRADPGRVFPGKKMAKHLGMVTQTTQNLKVVSYDADNKLLMVQGAVPGNKSWVVRITKAVKKVADKKSAGKK
ncbi:MAG: 50S ribosomal protein L3 [Oligoflexia bacterium]|nr:50S ribosomal protein L3 [Oligoflexia bacterium]